jgi:hypothetical protein
MRDSFSDGGLVVMAEFVVGEGGAKPLAPVSEHQVDVRHEVGLLLNVQDT